MVFAGLLTLIKNAGKNLQINYLGRTKNNVRNVNPYGFFSNPPRGSKVVAFEDKTGGYYGIAYLDSVIPSLEEGEVATGNFQVGNIVKFDKEGNIEITTKSGKEVRINNTTIVAGGSNRVLTEATIINDSTGSPCTIISGYSEDLKTT